MSERRISGDLIVPQMPEDVIDVDIESKESSVDNVEKRTDNIEKMTDRVKDDAALVSTYSNFRRHQMSKMSTFLEKMLFSNVLEP